MITATKMFCSCQGIWTLLSFAGYSDQDVVCIVALIASLTLEEAWYIILLSFVSGRRSLLLPKKHRVLDTLFITLQLRAIQLKKDKINEYINYSKGNGQKSAAENTKQILTNCGAN